MDQGGGRRSIFLSRYAKIFYIVGLFGLIGGLLPLVLITGGSSGGISNSALSEPPIRRLVEESDLVDLNEITKPTLQFDAEPLLSIDAEKQYIAIMELAGGDVELELFADIAPLHVNNFVFLARQGFYDGLTFHRVIHGFVAQGGDPTGSGLANAGYILSDENVGENASALTLGSAGIISMARSANGASSSQFFITLSPQESLDKQGFTAFGKVINGMKHVQAIPERNPQTTVISDRGAEIVSIKIKEISDN